MYCEMLVKPSGATPDEYRGYAAGCLGWARTAKSDREREIYIQMANTWFKSAIRASGKDRTGISTSLQSSQQTSVTATPLSVGLGQIVWTHSLHSFFSPSDSHIICAVVWLLHGRGRAWDQYAKMLTVQQFMSLLGHNWQDIALSMGNIFFCVTLVPMLRHPGRPPLLTCVPTGLGLLAGGFVFATLHLWITALTQVLTGLQWLALAFKKSSSNRHGLAAQFPTN
jgi:hypothetical protein